MAPEYKKTHKYRYLVPIAVCVVIFFLVIIYFKPNQSETSDQLKFAEQQSNNKHDDPLQPLDLEEDPRSQRSTQNPATIDTALDESTLYDTKSDMRLQPVDPESDPGNKVDAN